MRTMLGLGEISDGCRVLGEDKLLVIDCEGDERLVLFALNREEDTTLVLVTHDLELAQRTGRVIRLRGGTIFSDSNREDRADAP